MDKFIAIWQGINFYKYFFQKLILLFLFVVIKNTKR